MIKPDEEVVRAIAASVRQYPVIQEWMTSWRNHELNNLPNSTQNTALAQGRCQVLSEVTKLIEQSPETFSAKS